MKYVITDSGVVVGKTIAELNKKLGIKLEHEEMYHIGPDSYVKLTAGDMEFLQDKRRMSQIMFSQFFKKDNSIRLLVMVNLMFSAFIFFLK